jgi:hypothetical protein
MGFHRASVLIIPPETPAFRGFRALSGCMREPGDEKAGRKSQCMCSMAHVGSLLGQRAARRSISDLTTTPTGTLPVLVTSTNGRARGSPTMGATRPLNNSITLFGSAGIVRVRAAEMPSPAPASHGGLESHEHLDGGEKGTDAAPN